MAVANPGKPICNIPNLKQWRSNGAAAHAVGRSYFDNPMVLSEVPVDTPEHCADWESLCNAWAAGWIQADGGRDPAMKRLFGVRYW
jgi:hypothetical protein